VPSQAVLGIPLAVTDYERTLDWIDAAVASRHRGYICVAAVHTVMACQEDPALRAAVLAADFTVPDGQPLVWALRALGPRAPASASSSTAAATRARWSSSRGCCGCGTPA
jgi:N-acetylglucosaminyldiphosphoundecaprenol N-acetyl-beta-D-mannosaminyltransferase